MDAEPAADAGLGGAVAWVVSAKTGTGLAEQAARLAAHIAVQPGLEVTEVAAGLAGRSAFAHRAVVTGSELGELTAGLDAVAAGAGGERGHRGERDGGWGG